MIPNKVKDDIAKLSFKPTLDRLSARASEVVTEEFCKPHCGHGPEGKLFCSDAEGVYKRFLSLLVKTYCEHN